MLRPLKFKNQNWSFFLFYWNIWTIEVTNDDNNNTQNQHSFHHWKVMKLSRINSNNAQHEFVINICLVECASSDKLNGNISPFRTTKKLWEKVQRYTHNWMVWLSIELNRHRIANFKNKKKLSGWWVLMFFCFRFLFGIGT